MMRHTLASLFIASIITSPALADPPDTIYLNATILTLDPHNTTTQALATNGETILATGTNEDIQKLATPATKIHDLHGQTITPGFYAAHDHFPAMGTDALFRVDLNSPPIGKIETIDQLVAALKDRLPQIPKGQWLVGRGYDDTLLKEHRHPTREDLDKVSTAVPIWIVHISGHLGVANSKALSLAKITRNTPQPRNGRIRHDANGDPNGVFEESGSMVSRLIPPLSQADQLRGTEWAVHEYASKGVTTAAVASGGEASLANLRRALDQNILKIRVISMTSGAPDEPARQKIRDLHSNRLKVGAIKLWQDGSIQGFTGYLSQPYFTPFQGDATYRGYASRTREALTEKVKEWHKAGYQIAIHANGDAAIEDVLSAYAAAQQENPRPDARHRIEHCQTVREDQLDRIQSLGITPSFFVGHVYYWGDRHRDLFLGPDRAARISPLASALSRGIHFTVHDDTPVTPVNPLLLVWDSVNRTTTSGQVLGPQQRITPEKALRAVTSDAAWQNFEENIKGTLEPGKLADFVILDQNPLTIDPKKIRDIHILQTIVGGEPIYTCAYAAQ